MTNFQRIASSIRNQKVLITGASGFIGAHLCRRLSEAGTEVHAISRVARESEEYGARWWLGDISDYSVVTRMFSEVKPETVVHLAACVTGRRDLEFVLPTVRNNLVASVNVLSAAVNTGCSRVILAGSLEEPDPDQGQPIPCSPYAASKWSMSGYARMFHQLYGLPVVTARLFMTYGPNQKDVQKLVPYVILSLLRGTPPKLGDGSRPVDWIYVDDVVDGILAITQAPNVAGQTIDVGSGRLVPIRAVVQQLVELTRCELLPQFGAIPDRPFERIHVADADETWAKTGWAAKTSLEDGLARTVAWYRQCLRAGISRVCSREEIQ